MAEINTSQYYPSVTLTITNDAGQPAEVDEPPVWASSDETVLSVVASDDGMSAQIWSVAPGTARATVSADADLGGGVKEITGFTEDITVVVDPASQASVMQLTLGEPADKSGAPQVNPLRATTKKK